MLDMTQTRKAHDTPGDDAPDSIFFAERFAALTPRERAQVMAYMVSLHQKYTA